MIKEHCKTCINFNNGYCQPQWWSKPLKIEQIKVCPCFIMAEGKYKFQKVRNIIKKDTQYIKDLLEDKADISIRNKELFKEQLELLVQEEIENTQKYLKELQEI